MTIAKKMILIVDDNPENRKVLGSLMVKNGYEVGVAVDGFKALEFIDKVKPDLILLDVMMPGMDGYEVCKKLKSQESTKNIPIIFLTAKTATEDIVKGFEFGGTDYVAKPFNTNELLARVNTQIALIKANEELEIFHKKEAVGAMVITTNHEISQPLTVALGSLAMLNRFTDITNFTEKQKSLILKTQNSLDAIKNIVKKYVDADEFNFVEYSEGNKMVKFNFSDIKKDKS